MKRIINEGWEFSLDGGSFAPVSVPHDWLIYDTNDLYKSGIGRYRVKINTGAEAAYLLFDGVYMDCTLTVNGAFAGEWKNGYTAFLADISAFARKGENEIEVTVRYNAPNSRWYSGAGIYRDVHLIEKPKAHITPQSIAVKTSFEDGAWGFAASAEVISVEPYELRHTLTKDGGAWSPDTPNMSLLTTELIIGGKVVDTEETAFGFREVCAEPGGFFINGKRVKLRGVNQHHDLGLFGAAFNKDAERRRLELLMEMGVNAVRCAHNPPASGLLDLCDELGLLVMDEFSDVWEEPKSKYDYARFFREWHERDARSWIRRDRNHPCVVLWSIGNEIHDTHAGERGMAVMRDLIAQVKENDIYAHAPVTFGSNYLPWEPTQKCADIIKLVGYNYAERLYNEHREKHPDWIIFGSETGSNVASRGIYHFPLSKDVLADDDLQCSALGNSATSWGAKNPEALIAGDPDFSLGQFVWTGTDYIGEPTPYHTKNSYFGHIDTAGFVKDSFYTFKAAWGKEPFLWLYPYWDFSEGQLIDVRIATNTPETELFLNGVSLGKQRRGDALVINFRVEYAAGVLEARSGDLSVRRVTPGEAADLDIRTRNYGAYDFHEITAADADGNPVDNASHRVKVSAEGGSLIGLDNGNSADYEQYRGTDERRLFSGKLLAVTTAGAKICAAITREYTRKIELFRDGLNFSAKALPDGVQADISWRVTDALGVDSPNAELIVNGNSAEVKPKGDGEVWVRAAVDNGSGHAEVIAVYPITLEGCGQALLDPYGFVSAGLCSSEKSYGLTNGNERGVATARESESLIVFENLDFGGYGSDTVTIPLFPLTNDPFDFDILSGGEPLLTARYDKGMTWNTYIPVTYKLPRRLKGVAPLELRFALKSHVKGISFEYQKTGARLCAKDFSAVYGDTFTKTNTALENIGNNVVVEIGDLRLNGENGITLSTRAKRANSVRLDFETGERTETVMIEIPPHEDYGEDTFDIPAMSGAAKLSLIFLPGCALDLAWVGLENCGK